MRTASLAGKWVEGKGRFAGGVERREAGRLIRG